MISLFKCGNSLSVVLLIHSAERHNVGKLVCLEHIFNAVEAVFGLDIVLFGKSLYLFGIGIRNCHYLDLVGNKACTFGVTRTAHSGAGNRHC